MLTFHKKELPLEYSRKESAPTPGRTVGLVSLSEQERQYLVEVLHDEVIQLNCQILRLLQDTLTTVCVPIEVYANTVEALQLMNRSIDYLRDITEKFSLPYIDRGSLVPAVRTLLQQVQKKGRLCCSLIVEGFVEKLVLQEEQERVLYSIFQEAVMNVLQHAHSSVVEVTLSCTCTTLILKIEDNGRGFVLREPVGVSRERHLGLALIRERVKQLKGTFTIDSIVGKGTVLTIQVPLSDVESEKMSK